ncbi:MAG: AarF/UbiB family protein, partial [Gammaproteobacteria bacterium]|nr:AarF/UbiB family protein [Gammaproteobacteria bacterium]
GAPVSDIPALQASNINLKQLAENGVNIFFTQVFEHNFFHADMHPGNIFVATDEPEAARFIAIDCAIIGSLTRDDQQYLAKNLLAIFRRNYRRVAELHVDCGWVPESTSVHEFESAIRTVCEPFFEKPLKDISFAQILVELFRTAGRFDMEVQPSLILLQKTLLNIEGLGRQLYPELDLWQTALPCLERWNRNRLNPLTVLGKLQDNIPDLVDQLPDLPAMLVNAMTQTEQLQAIDATLRQSLKHQQQQERKRKDRSLLSGLICLAIAAGLMLPGINLLLAEISLLAAGIAALGIWLLFFRQ